MKKIFAGEVAQCDNFVEVDEFLRKNISEQIDSTEIFQFRSMAKKIKAAFLMRSKQVDEIKEFMRNSPHRIILCGDFNDSPVSLNVTF